MSTQQAMANVDSALAQELEAGMRSEANRTEAARAQVRRTTSVSADSSSRAMRHASEKALTELESRRVAYLEDLSTKHTAETERLKQQASELDRRIDDMQHALAELIEQRGETDRDIREERKRFEAAHMDGTRKFAVLINSQRQVINAIDDLGDGA